MGVEELKHSRTQEAKEEQWFRAELRVAPFLGP
jgi:hypothetical protein